MRPGFAAKGIPTGVALSIAIARGARWVLGNHLDTLHGRLVAPWDIRVERYIEKERTDQKTLRQSSLCPAVISG